ncbi:hypothetical protein F4810DRAFT_716142 [Camillea tinctor]|nr:hypothetical protein F4810DRAFT_716142 [Camillea tinctor]
MPFSGYGGSVAILEDPNLYFEPQGYSNTEKYSSHRCYTPGIKLRDPRERQKENSRDSEDSLSEIHGAYTYCHSHRPPQDLSNRALAENKPSLYCPESSEACKKQSLDYNVITTWLNHVAATTEDGGCDTFQKQPLSMHQDKLDPGNAQVRLVDMERHRSRYRGSGFDGPYSSNDDTTLLLLSDALGSPSRSSTNRPRKFRSDLSGSIDWEKSWPKRKPRRIHNVSEVSQPDLSRHTRIVDSFSAMTQSESIDDCSRDDLSCSDIVPQDNRLRAISQCQYALKSCPDLHRQLDGLGASRQVTESSRPVAQPDYSEFDRYRLRYRQRSQRAITRRFRSFGRRFRGSSSSSYSVRSEFPAPPDRKERRFLARDSAEIWPSSDDEEPVYNTPESNASLFQPGGSHINPLAMAGMMIAAAELDRLSGTVNRDKKSKVSESSLSQTPISSGITSPSSGTSVSGSTAAYVPPKVPFNSPSSMSQSGVSSPSTRPSQRAGPRRRAQRSRLSEVTTPEEIISPADSIDNRGYFQAAFYPSTLERLPALAGSSNESVATLYPKPLSTSRSSPSRVETPLEDMRDDSKYSTPGITVSGSDHKSIKSVDDESLFQAIDSVLTPPRTSSIGKTRNSIHARNESDGTESADKGSRSISHRSSRDLVGM